MELTKFQTDVLVAVAKHPMERGLVIKRELEDMGYGSVNHGRLYPNLDDLDEAGLIKKHPRKQDERSNAYEITTDGIVALEEREATIQSGLERSYAR